MPLDTRPCVNCSETIVKDIAGEEWRHASNDAVRCATQRPDFPDVPEVATVDLADGIPHVGHRAHFTGAWYCDTCDSPYCDLL